MGDEGLSAEQLSHRFVDAFNRRDADALVALTHPDVEFLPTVLVGQRAVHRGHDAMRRWVADLVASGAVHQARIRAVRHLSPDRFVMLTEVLIEDEVMSPSAMVVALRDGLIVYAKAYLSDEQTLIRVGVLPPRDDA